MVRETASGAILAAVRRKALIEDAPTLLDHVHA
jgi:hypothetical protein